MSKITVEGELGDAAVALTIKIGIAFAVEQEGGRTTLTFSDLRAAEKRAELLRVLKGWEFKEINGESVVN
ncbi:hypothetical protein HZA43_05005 [Candidatus Peregrinibacteria bacterium]|nr:hypothetical protein [Candidatus Peregrinibacteria bacterium]